MTSLSQRDMPMCWGKRGHVIDSYTRKGAIPAEKRGQRCQKEIVHGLRRVTKRLEVASNPCWHVTVITGWRDLTVTHPARWELGKWSPHGLVGCLLVCAGTGPRASWREAEGKKREKEKTMERKVSQMPARGGFVWAKGQVGGRK